MRGISKRYPASSKRHAKPEPAPAEPSENLKKMRVKHLLTMNTGHDTDPSPVVRPGKAYNSTTRFRVSTIA